jgi:hypothetical protein
MNFLSTKERTKPESNAVKYALSFTTGALLRHESQRLATLFMELSDWELDGSGTIHARHIATDTGWKILLDRGLDIFQHYDMQDAFALSNRLQKFRRCKAFEVTFVKSDSKRQEH